MDIAVSPRPMEILLVEDDPDDAFLVQGVPNGCCLGVVRGATAELILMFINTDLWLQSVSKRRVFQWTKGNLYGRHL